MIQITHKIEGSVDRNSINSINKITSGALSNQDVSKIKIPQLCNMIQKGQKVPVSLLNSQIVDVCMGWNVNNSDCDVDVSAFLLNDTGSQKIFWHLRRIVIIVHVLSDVELFHRKVYLRQRLQGGEVMHMWHFFQMVIR